MGETKTVTICWENYLQCLSERMWSFFNANELVDVTLTCHGQSIKVHGFILSLFSPVLKETLNGGGVESMLYSKHGPPLQQAVNLDFVTDHGADIKYLLEFLYRGQVTLPEVRVKHLLNTAGVLGIQRLVDAIQSLGCQYVDVLHQVQEVELKATQDNAIQNESVREEIHISNSEEIEILSTPEDSLKNDNSALILSADLRDSANARLGSNVETLNTGDEEVYFKSGSECELNSHKDDFRNSINNDQKEEGVKDIENPCDEEKGTSEQLQKSKRKAYQSTWRKSRPFLECSDCDYKSRDTSNFKKHMEHHNPAYGLHKYSCEICSKTFRSRRGFKCHQLGHGDPERQHKCFVCDFCTPQRWSLIKHLAVLHKVDEKGTTIAENIKCSQCSYSCIADHQLKAHVLRKHTDPLNKPFKCEQCSYSTVIKYELEKHIGIRHRNERRYMCEYCSFRSQTHSGLVRHQRAHSGIKPYKCHVCGMEYADGGKFKAHILRHSKDEKGFICHICAHACRRKDNLRMHLRRIHGTDLDETGDAGLEKVDFSKDREAKC